MMKKLAIPEDDSASSGIGGFSMQLDKQCSINPGAYHDFEQKTTSTKATTTFSLGAQALDKYKAMKSQPCGGFMRRPPEWMYGYCGAEWWVVKRSRWWHRDEHGTWAFAKCKHCDNTVEYAGCTYNGQA